jgi:hypothetical protein
MGDKQTALAGAHEWHKVACPEALDESRSRLPQTRISDPKAVSRKERKGGVMMRDDRAEFEAR